MWSCCARQAPRLSVHALAVCAWRCVAPFPTRTVLPCVSHFLCEATNPEKTDTTTVNNLGHDKHTMSFSKKFHGRHRAAPLTGMFIVAACGKRQAGISGKPCGKRQAASGNGKDTGNLRWLILWCARQLLHLCNACANGCIACGKRHAVSTVIQR